MVSAASIGDAYANLRQPNQFSTLCWLGVAVLLFGRIGVGRRAQFVLMALLAVASAATTSRTALLQMALLAAALLAWPSAERGHRWRMLGVAALGYAAALVLLPWIAQAATGVLPSRTLWGRVGSIDSCSSRRVLWEDVLHLVAQRPWAGWGWGELDYAHFVTPYPGARFCDILDNAHNFALHLAVELGVPFAVLACAGAAVWGLRRRPWAEADPLRQLAWMLAGMVLVHSLLEYPLWYGPFQIVFGAALAWLGAGTVSRWSWPPLARVVVGVAGLCLVAAAAWDYVLASQAYLPVKQRWAAAREDPLATARRARLFASQATFAELTLTAPSRANATAVWAQSQAMLHYSPEPRVVERAIDSALLLGKDQEAAVLLARYKAAFPKDAQRYLAAPRAQD
nr:Wzy polymerase domain-containing protein [Ramlibacter algicola]